MKYKIVMLMALLFVGCVSSGPHTRGEFDIILTPDVWTELQETNTYWNRNMIYDASKPFYWAIPLDFRGDCKNIALAKQADLKSKNIPSYIATCNVWDNVPSGHAVTIVHTDRGDFVLDIIGHRRVFNINNSLYTWTGIECEDRLWRKLDYSK